VIEGMVLGAAASAQRARQVACACNRMRDDSALVLSSPDKNDDHSTVMECWLAAQLASTQRAGHAACDM